MWLLCDRRDKKYMDELTYMEMWGLWGIECQSYNMWCLPRRTLLSASASASASASSSLTLPPFVALPASAGVAAPACMRCLPVHRAMLYCVGTYASTRDEHAAGGSLHEEGHW